MNDRAYEWLNAQAPGRKFDVKQVDRVMFKLAKDTPVGGRVSVVFTPLYGRDGSDLHIMSCFSLGCQGDRNTFRCVLTLGTFREGWPVVVCVPGEDDFYEAASLDDLKGVVGALLRKQVRKYLAECAERLENFKRLAM